MDTLFHFVFSVMAGLAVGVHMRHRMRGLLGVAFFAVAIDIDHFFGMSARGTLHNIFMIFLIPLVLFIVSYKYEGGKSVRFQTFSLLLMVMLAGHVVADMFYGGGVKLLYPLSEEEFSVPPISVDVTDDFPSPVIGREGVILAIYSIILLSAVFIEDFIYAFEKRHKRLRKALGRVLKDLF